MYLRMSGFPRPCRPCCPPCNILLSVNLCVCFNGRSYLQAVENLKAEDSELDRSKPFVPNLESSDQLVESEESVLEGNKRGRVEIDATPLPVRKKARRGKKVDENVEPVSLSGDK